MVAPNTLVEATVEQLEPYGAWIACDGQRGLINIPEISWIPIRHPSDVLSVGQRIQVKVLAVAEREFAASLRAVHPELDPWFDPSAFTVGTTFVAPVALVTTYGCFVELRPGLRALLRRDEWIGEIHVGDRIGIVVKSVDVEGRRIEVSSLPAD